jgi:hypothetical protein
MEELENRALGRSKETVEHTGTNELDRLLAMSPEEREGLRAKLAERRARLKRFCDRGSELGQVTRRGDRAMPGSPPVS